MLLVGRDGVGVLCSVLSDMDVTTERYRVFQATLSLSKQVKKGTEISDATRYTIIMYCTYIIVHLDQEYISGYSNMYRHI